MIENMRSIIGIGLRLLAVSSVQALSPKTQAVIRQPQNLPVVMNTWFANAAQLSYDMVLAGFTALDSIEAGCTLCEDLQCDGTVGYGGSVDSFGDVSLDALIMDAETHDVGAVTNLRNVRHAISAARKVLHYSTHTLLSGDGGEYFLEV